MTEIQVKIGQTLLLLLLAMFMAPPIFLGLDGTREPTFGVFEGVMSVMLTGLLVYMGVVIWTA
jgi:hypothetical protein